MYTCDLCGVDVLDPENLMRVWIEKGPMQKAILVCDECLDEDTDTGGYLVLAESDPHWNYLELRPLS